MVDIGWIPAHATLDDIQSGLISPIDFTVNHLADACAGYGAEQNAVPHNCVANLEWQDITNTLIFRRLRVIANHHLNDIPKRIIEGDTKVIKPSKATRDKCSQVLVANAGHILPHCS